MEGKHSSVPSFVSELLDEGNIGNEEAEAMIRDCAALAYGGSSFRAQQHSLRLMYHSILQLAQIL